MVRHPHPFGIIQDTKEVCQPPESAGVDPDGVDTRFENCLTCPGGRNCRKCLRGDYGSPPLLVLDGYESAEILRHRQGRFMVRAHRGVMCGIARGLRFRWFVMTESDEAIAAGLDFGGEFRKFVVWLRYRCPDFQYIVVEHRQGDKQRRNFHVLSCGSDKLPVLLMREYWLKRFKSTITGMEEVKDIEKAVKYLASYLGSADKFVRSWCSEGWVFAGWIGFSWAYRRSFGEFLGVKVLVALSLMSPDAREAEMEWLTETGKMSGEYHERG